MRGPYRAVLVQPAVGELRLWSARCSCVGSGICMGPSGRERRPVLHLPAVGEQHLLSGPYPGSASDRDIANTLPHRLGDPAYTASQPASQPTPPASQTFPRWPYITSPHQQQLESVMDRQIQSMSDQQILNILRLPEGSPAYIAAAEQYSRDLHQQLQRGEGA